MPNHSSFVILGLGVTTRICWKRCFLGISFYLLLLLLGQCHLSQFILVGPLIHILLFNSLPFHYFAKPSYLVSNLCSEKALKLVKFTFFCLFLLILPRSTSWHLNMTKHMTSEKWKKKVMTFFRKIFIAWLKLTA